MLLYHVTPRRYSVFRSGLNPAYDRRGKGRVWLCSRVKLGWAIWHVALTHKTTPERLTAIIVDVPRAWLYRRRRGVWYCKRLIPASRLL